MEEAPSERQPELSGVVVHWHNEAWLEQLVAAWPRDPRFELVVVNNGSSRALPAGEYLRLEPGANLGFGAGMNFGVARARAPLLLLLNPDVEPQAGALEKLLEGFEANPQAAGLAPRLVGLDDSPQFRWQLRRLPGPGDLLLQCLFLGSGLGAREEPPPGTAVAQPAAAALALRREGFEALGGFDPRFFPAWFEDVDLARRLADRGQPLLYWPRAVFRHGLGSSVSELGYGPFLWVYDRNLMRYLERHHGRAWAWLARALRAFALGLRLLLLPLRAPARARSRGEAARGLAIAWLGVVSGWRRPQALATRFAPPAEVEP